MARRDASAPGPRPRVLVVGGGLIGLLTARELALAGARVEVVDDRREGAASPAAAGMIAPVAESAADLEFARVSIRSRDLWRELAAALERESGMSIDYDESGSLLPLLDPDDRADSEGRRALDRIRARALELGEPVRDLDRAELRELAADLRPGIEEALLLPGEHRVDNRLATMAAAAALRRRNVALHRATVERVVEADGQVVVSGDGFERAAGAVVVCCGAWTPRVQGLPALPIVPVKGQMIAFDRIDWPFTGVIRTPAFYAVRRAGGRLLIGASVEHAGFDLGLSDEVGADLAAKAAALLPALKDREPVEHWAGLRPGTPDSWPIVGRVSERLHVAAGHFRNGILLAPLTAGMIAPLALDQQPDDPGLAIPDAMLPNRFAAWRLSS